MPKKKLYMQDQVWKGIEVLDNNWYSWRRNLDLDILDMGSKSLDVLGQLYGNYDDALEGLGIYPKEAHEYGFTTSDRDKNFENMSYLRDTWVALMHARRPD